MDFNSKNEGVWFFFDEEDESQGGVCLRELSPKQQKEIESKTTKRRRKLVAGSLVEVVEEDEDRRDRMVWDYCIVDWKNVQLDGVAMECTAVNKVKMVQCLGFLKWLRDKSQELSDRNDTVREAREKNSRSLSSGKEQSQPAENA